MELLSLPEYRKKKLIPAAITYKREDLYDQNLSLKLNINDIKDDNLRLRTKLK
jgi:hypothetical protein